MRRRKCAPYNPAAATAALLAPVPIDDPTTGAQTVAMRSVRDPLSWLFTHNHINEAQHDAGLAFQADVESLAGDVRAFDPGRDVVDCVRPDAEQGIDRLRRARARLQKVASHLGLEAATLARDVLLDGMGLEEIARERGLSHRQTERLSHKFRQVLDAIAIVYGLASEPKLH